MNTSLLKRLRLLLIVSATATGFSVAAAPGSNAGSNKPNPPSPTPPSPSAPLLTPPSQVTVKRQVLPPPAEPALTPTGRVNSSAAAGLETARFAPNIRSAPLTTRDQVLADLEARFSTSETTMSSLEKSAAEMNPEARKQFRAAENDVKEKAKTLRKSMQSARTANEQEWSGARVQLAADYEAYSAALARVDALAGPAR